VIAPKLLAKPAFQPTASDKDKKKMARQHLPVVSGRQFRVDGCRQDAW